MSVALVVNLRAGRGSQRLKKLAERRLPAVRVAATRNVEELGRFVDDVLARERPGVLLSGGGDGTAIRLLDEFAARDLELPVLGLLPLGTGNAWAHTVGAPSAVRGLERLSRRQLGALPTLRFSLVRIEGRLTPFAGTGWDADIVADYRAQNAALPPWLKRAHTGLPGYMTSIFTRTAPRHLRGETPPRVRLINLGEPALFVDASGRSYPAPGGTRGALLYEGPYGVAGAGTSTDLGFGFKALHLGRHVPGRMHVRVYHPSVLTGLLAMPRLWRGEHPLPHSYDVLLTRCRMEFDREVSLEIGGDLVGKRRSIEFEIADRTVDVLDWSRLH
jgi:diacylglycerol kinase family enzyme